jgi:predicted small integral membrane protein
LLLWAGCLRLLAAIGGEDFNRAKALAVSGLSLGFLLYAVGFVSIGGEWFAMWQSQIWNGEQKAFDFIGMIGAVLVVVLLSDPASQ